MSCTSKTWKVPKPVTPETAVKAAVKAMLAFMGWRSYPITQSMGSHPGLPDRIALKNGITVYVEVKGPDGKPSDHQKQFQEECERAGCFYALVRSAEELKVALESLIIVVPDKTGMPGILMTPKDGTKIIRADVSIKRATDGR